MTVLGSRPLGRPYLGRISQTVGGAGLGSGSGSGSRSDSDLGIERRKNREIIARIRREFKLLAAMVFDERRLGGRRRIESWGVLVLEVFC